MSTLDEAARDATSLVHLVATGRLDDADVFMSTMEWPEVRALLICLGGLGAALAQELDETLVRHGEPRMAAQFFAAMAQHGFNSVTGD